MYVFMAYTKATLINSFLLLLLLLLIGIDRNDVFSSVMFLFTDNERNSGNACAVEVFLVCNYYRRYSTSLAI